MHSRQVIIIGGGLSGLTTAYLLKKAGINSLVLESRERLGGRIYTSYNQNEASIEMGATWLGTRHQYLVKLLQELDLKTSAQHYGNYTIYDLAHLDTPHLMKNEPNTIPNYRIDGGSSQLIQVLANQLDNQQIALGHVVTHIDFQGDHVQVQTNKGSYTAQVVISTLPPALLVNAIAFSSSLPQKLLQIAQQTHTWMGESIKMGIRYANPFWRSERSSGTILGNNGAVNECYDHSDMDSGYFALKGFIHPSLYQSSRLERIELVINQLQKYYGEQAKDYLSYEEYVWRNDVHTYTDYGSSIEGHQNNGLPIFRETYFNGRFFISGAETAKDFPGYMDGAVQSAYRVLAQILELNLPNQSSIMNVE